MRRETIKRTKRVAIKVGSAVLTQTNGMLNETAFKGLALEVFKLRNRGIEAALVTSGAVAAGMAKLGLTERPKSIPEKQAAAAAGQSSLMGRYERVFASHDLNVAQILLTHEDLSSRHRYLNARNTLFTLLSYGVVPIINENDTVVVDEIKFGDNDNLSALVAGLIDADLLLILTDTDGLYDKDPRSHADANLIPLVEKIDSHIEHMAGGVGTSIATGGMITKIQAAKKASTVGIATIIASGRDMINIEKVFASEKVGTLFLSQSEKLTSRKHWIATVLKSKGKIVVDDGARDALISKGKSLLPTGIVGVEGDFGIGDAVLLEDKEGNKFAQGLAGYTNAEILLIMGHRSSRIEEILGYK
ncbi:MAG TPA: glutamate 5-kinase, partial [Thermodesulfobacteriota bacterium]|nr:glutamate 5-kinase [Thermodesulfobacteriota bacterium]